MLTRVFKFLVLLSPLVLSTQAFWWRSSSTEAPSPPPSPIMKQIPLTYFRTYTYQQPLVSNPIQLPSLSSPDYTANYNALSNTPYFNPMLPVVPISFSTNNEIPIEPKPIKNYDNFNLVRSLGSLPEVSNIMPVRATKTTTTTTTTPEPTTTTTTTSTTTKPTATTTTATLQMDSARNAIPFIRSESYDNAEASYPAFNRKPFNNNFNINYNRPVYPYPEYLVHKFSTNNNDKNQDTHNIEFVHCMCPVNIPNIGFPSSYENIPPVSGNPANSLFLSPDRKSVETEAALDVSVANETLNVNKTAGSESSNLVEDLQMIKTNGEEGAATTA